MSCTCDYSYVCGECQLKIDVENQERYLEELTTWVIAAIQAIAAASNVQIPAPPQKPGKY